MFSDIIKNGEYKNLVNGKWVESSSKELISISSPVDGSLVGKVQAMSMEEADVVV